MVSLWIYLTVGVLVSVVVLGIVALNTAIEQQKITGKTSTLASTNCGELAAIAKEAYESALKHLPPAQIELSIYDVRVIRCSHIHTINDLIQKLPNNSFDKPALADKRKAELQKALFTDSDSVYNFIKSDMLKNAIVKVQQIRAKMDSSASGNPTDDWIVEPRVQQQLLDIIDNYIGTLEKD